MKPQASVSVGQGLDVWPAGAIDPLASMVRAF